jgi:hypothetical protein
MAVEKIHVVQVIKQGPPGPSGLLLNSTGWSAGTKYLPNNSVVYNGSTYACRTEHVATAEDEPGVGAAWQDFWQEWPLTAEMNSRMYFTLSAMMYELAHHTH